MIIISLLLKAVITSTLRNRVMPFCYNSLAPENCGCDFAIVSFKLNLRVDIMSDIWRVRQNPISDLSILFRYLSQCVPDMLSYGIARPQQVNYSITVLHVSWISTASPLIQMYRKTSNISRIPSRQLKCRSLRCSRSIACRRCSNYIFILDLTSGFTGFAKDSRKTVREYFKCWVLVRLILETWRYSLCNPGNGRGIISQHRRNTPPSRFSTDVICRIVSRVLWYMQMPYVIIM